jgi:hypothetical protein
MDFNDVGCVPGRVQKTKQAEQLKALPITPIDVLWDLLTAAAKRFISQVSLVRVGLLPPGVFHVTLRRFFLSEDLSRASLASFGGRTREIPFRLASKVPVWKSRRPFADVASRRTKHPR